MLLLLLLIVVCGPVNGAGNVFSSMNSLQSLITTEANVIESLKHIITQEEERLIQLKRYVSHYERAHEKAVQEGFRYLTNPLNGYQLIKRLTSDWTRILAQVESPVVNITRVRQALDLPTVEDLAGAADGLCRLLQTYNLDPTQLARGVIDGVQYSEPMSAGDAFEVGLHMYRAKDYFFGAIWFQVALDLLPQEPETDPMFEVSRAQILDYLAFAFHSEGHLHMGLKLTKEYLQLKPNCTRNQANVEIYEKIIAKRKIPKPLEDPKIVLPNTKSPDLTKTFEKLCRGEVKVNHNLVCRYEDNNIPYLFLGKVKLEEVNLDPWIVLYHDAIYDSEIATLKERAKSDLKRSFISTVDTSGKIVEISTRSRVSMTATLDRKRHKVVDTVDRRAAMLANLADKAAESFQVMNYGIGGHYAPHFDHAENMTKGYFGENFPGNRIASLLFYMSDVERGGATVFIYPEVAVFPRKGSALFWYNLHRDGQGDHRTMHAGCPVLIGSKWGGNKWYHEEFQEFRRPCLLEQDSLRVKDQRL